MFSFSIIIALLSLFLSLFSISPYFRKAKGPIVTLPDGQYRGFTNGTPGLSYFLGMRYAAPPVDALRYHKPQPPPSFTGVHDATRYGAACLQQTLSNVTIPGIGSIDLSAHPANQSEDCLFVNVIRPTTIPEDVKLPVLFWIHGGGFQIGDPAENPASPLIERSIALGEPLVYVSAAYRLNGFGFLGSKETQAGGVGNLGLRDQRLAMEWIQQNIHLFGGDKEKVTIWGPSAGSVSVGFHLILNDGNPAGLFRGAFMNSGFVLPSSASAGGQHYYDAIVKETGCSDSKDTLECLRTVSGESIQNAIQTNTPNAFSYQSMQLAYQPRVDGDLIKKSGWELIQDGAYARVPFIAGSCLDEGTMWALPQGNITTNEDFLDFVHRNHFPRASAAQIKEIGRIYPDDPAAGSPFNIGDAGSLFPQFKRLAAIEGDIAFQAPKRLLLTAASKTQDVWAFDFRRSSMLTPVLGVHHGSDGNAFGYHGSSPDYQGTDAVINFVNHLTPVPKNQNSSLSSVEWPTWGSSSSHPALRWSDPTELSVVSDTERDVSIKGLTALLLKYPFGFTDLPIEV